MEKPKSKRTRKPTEKITTKNAEIFRIELSKPQKEVINGLRENNISIIVGEAGTSKDTMSLYRGIDSIIKKEYENLILFRPLVQSGASLGYLKGDLSEKQAPYEELYNEHFKKIVDKAQYERIKSKIKFETEQFVRGKTFEHSYIAVSEAQNYTLHELITIVTRVSSTSTIVLNGDLMQSDIGKKSGLKDFVDILKDIDGVGVIELDSTTFQMRNPLIIEINKAYRNFLNK